MRHCGDADCDVGEGTDGADGRQLRFVTFFCQKYQENPTHQAVPRNSELTWREIGLHCLSDPRLHDPSH